jgi:hypothetical protein
MTMFLGIRAGQVPDWLDRQKLQMVSLPWVSPFDDGL